MVRDTWAFPDTSLQESWRYARDARDVRYTGSTRAARQRSGEGREAGEAVLMPGFNQYSVPQ